MPAEAPSPALWVQLTQALVARELVDGLGMSEREASARLGIAPSAVSQYLSGKRLGPNVRRHVRDDAARQIARRAAQRLATDSDPSEYLSVLLQAAVEMAGHRAGPGARGATSNRPDSEPETADLARWVRARIQGEQVAVAECMRLARRSRDELTRALFRQIASDSLRHAEIAAALGTYFERGISRTQASGISPADVDRLLAREHAAEASNGPDPGKAVGGVMALLWESMEADERKHEVLLVHLRDSLARPTVRPARRPAPAGPP